MQRIPSFVYFLTIIPVILSTIGYLYWLGPCKDNLPSGTQGISSQAEIKAQGLDYSTVNPEYELRLSIGNLEIEKKKLGIFTINPCHILNLKSVSIDFNLKSKARNKISNCSDSKNKSKFWTKAFQGLELETLAYKLMPKKKKLITNAKIIDFKLFLRRQDKPVAKISSRLLKIKESSISYILKDNVLMTTPKTRIRAKELVFQPKQALLQTRGPYHILIENGKENLSYNQCKVLRIDLDMNTIFCAQTGKKTVLDW